MPRKFAAIAAVAAAVLWLVPGPSGAAAGEHYGQYSRMLARSAGQYWSGGKAAGQWAWKPASGTESHISWGDPANWPPEYRERFIRSGDWLLLDGWWDNGTYYTLRVTNERIGDGNCANMRTFSSSGRQHYVKWNLPTSKYCLIATGTLTEKSSGTVINFKHLQKWSPAGSCSNAYYSGKRCITQYEVWWDNNGSPGSPITKKLTRTVKLARGIGMAFTIRQSYPSNWSADLRYHWTY